MKKLTFILLHLITIHAVYSQQAVIKSWDARFGGTTGDYLYGIGQTSNGGFILGGYSLSGISGNKSQALIGDADYWIVKVDANGNKLWDKDYGGPGDNSFTSLCMTTDGGCLLGGILYGAAGDDVSEPSRGGLDYWVIKLDSLGNKQWDARFGGDQDDDLYCVTQTRDGGYILGGRSNSGISGDKTQPNWDPGLGTGDYWIVKIDSSGHKQWDKRFGTVWDESCVNILQTPDGGYLIGGSTLGDTTGDKTQLNYGQFALNYWMVKTDSLGNKQWDHVYGGTNSETFGNSLVTNDGNYLLGGTSVEGIVGDKTTNMTGYWLVKIDTSGNKLGDWAYGTDTVSPGGFAGEQTFGSMTKTHDGGYLLTGTSGSVIGGDKTENNLGSVNVWTIRIDSNMNRVWDKTSLTTGEQDKSAGAIEVDTSCYLIGVQTSAGVGGDKSQPNWTRGDTSPYNYWIVEYCNDTFPLGIRQSEGAMHLLVYPNPTSGDLYINIQKDNLKEASFTLTNTTGQTIYQSTADHLANSYTKILDLSILPTGIYLLDVTVDGERIVKKVLKE